MATGCRNFHQLSSVHRLMSRPRLADLPEELRAAGTCLPFVPEGLILPEGAGEEDAPDYVPYAVSKVVDCVDVRRSSKSEKGTGQMKVTVFRPDAPTPRRPACPPSGCPGILEPFTGTGGWRTASAGSWATTRRPGSSGPETGPVPRVSVPPPPTAPPRLLLRRRPRPVVNRSVFPYEGTGTVSRLPPGGQPTNRFGRYAAGTPCARARPSAWR